MLSWRRVTKTFCAYTGLVFALLTVVAPRARAEQDWSVSARALVRELMGDGAQPERVVILTRNRLPNARLDLGPLEDAVAEALRASGIDTLSASEEPSTGLTVTLASTPRGLLLVGEMGAFVAVVELDGLPGGRANIPQMTVRATRLIEQQERILDVALVEDALLVLSPAAVLRYASSDDGWQLARREELDVAPRVRDPRGRLQARGAAFQAWLPGAFCFGSLGGSTRCSDEEADWPFPIDGVRLTEGRNWFTHPRLRPFFSLARAGSNWAVAHADGSVVVYDDGFHELRTLDGWGSDLVGLGGACGGQPLLVTSPTDSHQRDAVWLYVIYSGRAIEVSSPVAFPGPVVTLWPAGDQTALAVARDLETRKYVAFRLDLDCGR